MRGGTGVRDVRAVWSRGSAKRRMLPSSACRKHAAIAGVRRDKVAKAARNNANNSVWTSPRDRNCCKSTQRSCAIRGRTERSKAKDARTEQGIRSFEASPLVARGAEGFQKYTLRATLLCTNPSEPSPPCSTIILQQYIT